MRVRTAHASVCLALALLGIIIVGCGRGYRQVVVVDGDSAQFVTIGKGPKEAGDFWAPNRVLLFRTDSTVPGAPAKSVGKAGWVYRVNDKMEMEEVGQFDLSIPNDTLAYRYGA
jgi:hypothetical protein